MSDMFYSIYNYCIFTAFSTCFEISCQQLYLWKLESYLMSLMQLYQLVKVMARCLPMNLNDWYLFLAPRALLPQFQEILIPFWMIFQTMLAIQKQICIQLLLDAGHISTSHKTQIGMKSVNIAPIVLLASLGTEKCSGDKIEDARQVSIWMLPKMIQNYIRVLYVS